MVTTQLPLRHTSPRLNSFLQFIYHLFQGLVLWLTPQSWRYKDLTGQTVLITGSGSGIGQLMAVKFATSGCSKVILWDLNESGMKETAQMIEEQAPSTAVHIYRVDLSKKAEIQAAAERAKAEVGVVDILVNNAGVISGRYFLDIPDELNQRTFDVNVLAHFWTIRAFLPDMITQKRGHIVTTASVAGQMGSVKVVDYCASKFANVGMDLALRQELVQANLDRFIKTTIVKPYLITTGLFAGCETFLFSPLTPDYVATRIINGVRAETEEIIIPKAFSILFFLITFLPSKCLYPLLDFGGLCDLMAHFTGRYTKGSPPLRVHELNATSADAAYGMK